MLQKSSKWKKEHPSHVLEVGDAAWSLSGTILAILALCWAMLCHLILGAAEVWTILLWHHQNRCKNISSYVFSAYKNRCFSVYFSYALIPVLGTTQYPRVFICTNVFAHRRNALGGNSIVHTCAPPNLATTWRHVGRHLSHFEVEVPNLTTQNTPQEAPTYPPRPQNVAKTS